MIKNIALDLGGVVVALNYEMAVSRFEALGVPDVRSFLNPYLQGGFFGDLEGGRSTAEEFRQELSRRAGRPLSEEECSRAVLGFIECVPEQNLETILRLRAEGYRLILISNTNPYVMAWGMSPAFDGKGHSLRHYFDACYLSYECKLMKPDPAFFRYVLEHEQILPEETVFVDDGIRNVEAAAGLGIRTLLAENGTDWTEALCRLLKGPAQAESQRTI